MAPYLELGSSLLMWASMLVGSIAMLVHALRGRSLDGAFPLYPPRIRAWILGESKRHGQ